MARVFVGVGSNTDPETNLKQGIRLLAERIPTESLSALYEDPLMSTPNMGSYLNGVLSLQTELQPVEIKAILVAVEDACGRVRLDGSGNKSTVVTLDFDLLLYGDSICYYTFASKTYRLPHGDIVTRAYVAVPLAHIAPQLVHPETGQTMLTIAAQFADTALIRRDDLRF